MTKQLTSFQILHNISMKSELSWTTEDHHQLIQCLDELSQLKSKSRYQIAIYEQELRNYIAEKTLELKTQAVKMTEKQIDAVLQLDEKRQEIQTKVLCEKYAQEQTQDKVEVCRNLITLVRDCVKPAVYPVLQ